MNHYITPDLCDAHPDLVPVAMEVFDEALGWNPNQISRTREDVELDDRALLNVEATQGTITEQGIRDNLWVGIQYIESWLRGHGAAANTSRSRNGVVNTPT